MLYLQVIVSVDQRGPLHLEVGEPRGAIVPSTLGQSASDCAPPLKNWFRRPGIKEK